MIRTAETKWNQIVTDILNKKFKRAILLGRWSNILQKECIKDKI